MALRHPETNTVRTGTNDAVPTRALLLHKAIVKKRDEEREEENEMKEK
jgi:hypothetical protein